MTHVARAPSPALFPVLRLPGLNVDISALTQPLPDFFGRESHNTNYLSAVALAGGNGNGRAWDLQNFCQKFDAGFVGLTIDGWRGKGNFERVTDFRADGIFLCAGMDFDGESHTLGGVLDRNQSRFTSENIVSIATRRLIKGT